MCVKTLLNTYMIKFKLVSHENFKPVQRKTKQKTLGSFRGTWGIVKGLKVPIFFKTKKN